MASFFSSLEIVLIQCLLGPTVLPKPELRPDGRGDSFPGHFLADNVPIDPHQEFGHAILQSVGSGGAHGEPCFQRLLLKDSQSQVILAMQNVLRDQGGSDHSMDAWKIHPVHLVIGDGGKHLRPEFLGGLDQNASVRMGASSHATAHQELVITVFDDLQDAGIFLDRDPFIRRSFRHLIEPFRPLIQVAKRRKGAVGCGIGNGPAATPL